MSNRTVRIILEAATGGYEAGMRRAGQATEAMRDALEKSVNQKQNLDQVAGALGAVGTAAGALVASVAKTGVEYNTLQQTSRAALRTILGGAEQANAQMDRLDNFARTSPFAKQVFLNAQREMLGFGIEAKKVIPYLDAIQDAVAATGGSNQDIAELVHIFAKIKGQAKITATELREFGMRGVDAATLIGNQMGMTGAEIREAITEGSLDAGEALDALAAGMTDRFGGAAANVKETFEGALDRIKAAFRDLSSSIMEPFVSTSGGGLFVGGANALADFLRTIEALPGPIKIGAAAITTLGAGIALLSAALLAAAPRIRATQVALAEMRADTGLIGSTTRGATVAISGLTKVLGAASLALLGLQAIGAIARQFQDAAASADELASAISDTTGNLNALERAFQTAGGTKQLWADINSLTDALDALAWSERWDNSAYLAIEGAIASLAGLEGRLDKLKGQFEALDSAMAGASFEDISRRFVELEASLEGTGYTVDDLAQRLPQTFATIRAQLAAASDEWASYGTTNEDVARVLRGDLAPGLALTEQGVMNVSQAIAAGLDYVDEHGTQMEIAAIRQQQAALAADEAAAAFSGWTVEQRSLAAAALEAASAAETQEDALAAVEKSVQEAAQAYAEMRSELAASAAAFVDIGGTIGEFVDDANFALGKYLDALEEQVAAQRDWQENMILLSARASDGLLEHLARLGPEGAPLVAALVDASDKELARMEAVYGARAEDATNAWADELINASPVWRALAATAGKGAVEAAAREVAAGRTTLAGIVDRYNLSFTISADASAAIRIAQAAISRINSMSANVRVGAYHRAGMNAPVATGGLVGHVADAYGLASGGMAERKSYPFGGLVHGPGTTTSDDIPARLSRLEFVQNAAATAYYGTDVMYALNSRRIPREVFHELGFAQGGTPERPYYSPTQTPTPSAPPTAALVLALRQGLQGATLTIDGKQLDAHWGFDQLDMRAHAAGGI